MENNFCQLALAVIEIESEAVSALSQKIGPSFVDACHILLACKGRIIVMGMGKSGHIANKIAATMSSTGTPALFVHPADAAHGDFGMVTKEDVIIAISNSGNSAEIITLLPLIKQLEIPLLSLTGNMNSPLAQASTVSLDVGVKIEACPLGLAPTTSTTTSLVMGDALAIALLDAKGFSAKDFALSHPGGKLGRQLLLRVDTLCHSEEKMPSVNERATVSEALIEVTEKKLGMTCVINKAGKLAGVFTDGDVRRALNNDINIHTTLIKDLMSKQSHTIKMGTLAIDALTLMQQHKITSLVIKDSHDFPLGVLHIHDLINAGVL
jgi:arabinose-5-phosphate isomerase